MPSNEYVIVGRGVKWRDHSRVNSPIIALNWEVGLHALEIFGSPDSNGYRSRGPVRNPEIKAIIENYRLTPLDIHSPHTAYVPRRWDWEAWLRNLMRGGWRAGMEHPNENLAWLWKEPWLRTHPPLETAAAAGRLAQALESHDPGIEPLWLEILRYDPNAHVTSDPDDEPYTPRDHFAWMFRQVEYICKELAGLGADVVTFVELHY